MRLWSPRPENLDDAERVLLLIGGVTLLIGLALLVLTRAQYGMFMAMGGMMLVATAGCMDKWRHERGLWMAGTLCAVLLLGLLTILGIGLAGDVRHRTSPLGWLDTEGVILIVLIACSGWYAAQAAMWNFRLTHRCPPATSTPASSRPVPPPSGPSGPEPLGVPARPRTPRPSLSAAAVPRR
jgi:hypothetical protein